MCRDDVYRTICNLMGMPLPGRVPSCACAPCSLIRNRTEALKKLLAAAEDTLDLLDQLDGAEEIRAQLLEAREDAAWEQAKAACEQAEQKPVDEEDADDAELLQTLQAFVARVDQDEKDEKDEKDAISAHSLATTVTPQDQMSEASNNTPDEEESEARTATPHEEDKERDDELHCYEDMQQGEEDAAPAHIDATLQETLPEKSEATTNTPPEEENEARTTTPRGEDKEEGMQQCMQKGMQPPNVKKHRTRLAKRWLKAERRDAQIAPDKERPPAKKHCTRLAAHKIQAERRDAQITLSRFNQMQRALIRNPPNPMHYGCDYCLARMPTASDRDKHLAFHLQFA
jgi:hypothetical protein